MLSRRNIRIKVMQMLYARSRDGQRTFNDVVRRYEKRIDESYELFVYALLLFRDITAYAVIDQKKRSSKHLPSPEDKIFRAKLFNNDLIQSIMIDEGLNHFIEKRKLKDLIDEDIVRKLYNGFSKSPEYKEYIFKQNCSNEDHKVILLALFKHCMSSELYYEELGDPFPCFTDDKSLITGTMKKTIKALPFSSEQFQLLYQPNKETAEEFGTVLLENVYNKDTELLAHIEPTLKNWDADRVAILDMIILKMALSELMIFPTIPTKVTLNEFVEISKLYSTDKSKDFINGILDRLMKKLNTEGKINKEGRGLQG